jgi:hypothetical protein
MPVVNFAAGYAGIASVLTVKVSKKAENIC